MGALGLLATGIGLYQFFGPMLRGPDPMTGDLNVAVAGFQAAGGSVDDADRDAADALGESVHRTLIGEVSSIRLPDQGELDVQVRGPDEVGEVDGSTPEDRAQGAAGIAADLDADVVLFGTLAARDSTVELTPEYYLAERKLRHPEDNEPVLGAVGLPPAPTGGQPLGSISVRGDIDASVTARAHLRSAVTRRTRAFALFIVGLAYYADALGPSTVNKPESQLFLPAARYFRAAELTGQWDPRVAEVLYVFLGNTALKRQRFGLAEKNYTRALKANPGYLRASLGRAEARFHRARDACAAGAVDARGLEAAIRGYRRVLLSSRSELTPVVRAKAGVGAGRAEWCRGYAGSRGHYDSAERYFRDVIALFEGGARLARPQAAEAYAGLGLVHLYADEGRPVAGPLRRAYGEYTTAIRLTDTSVRKGIFSGVRAAILAELGNYGQAAADYARAIRLDPQRASEYRKEARQVLPRGSSP